MHLQRHGGAVLRFRDSVYKMHLDQHDGWCVELICYMALLGLLLHRHMGLLGSRRCGVACMFGLRCTGKKVPSASPPFGPGI